MTTGLFIYLCQEILLLFQMDWVQFSVPCCLTSPDIFLGKHTGSMCVCVCVCVYVCVCLKWEEQESERD